MIVPTFSQARRHYAVAPTPLDHDGLPFWPGPVLPDQSIDGTGATGLLRNTGGVLTVFRGTVTASTAGGQSIPTGLIGPLVDAVRFSPSDPVFPINVTCNNHANDAVAGAHDFCWFISMRAEPGKHPVLGSTTPLDTKISDLIFTVTHPNPLASGTIQIVLNAGPAAKILPGLSGAQLLTADSFQMICRNVYVYVSRVSDKAFQGYKLYTRGIA